MLTEQRSIPDQETASIAPLARRPVLLIAGVMGLIMLATVGQYGYFGDELYFRSAGRHLSWGYADQPPLVPLLASAMDSLFPGSLVALRLPAVLLTATGVVVTALIARELGGQRRAQILAAMASATSPFLLACAGHWLATQMLDPFLWSVISWLVVRWVRTRQDRLLLFAGIVTAVALQGKLLIPVFWVAVAVAVLAVGPRELLTRRTLWIGGAITVVTAIPTLVWQASHGWPQLEMQRAIAREIGGPAARMVYLPAVLVMAGLFAGSVLLFYGLWRMLRSRQLRPYRFLGIAVVLVAAVFVISNGRPYYVVGMFALCWAAGAVELERLRPAHWWQRPLDWSVRWPSWVISALVAISFLPIIPASEQMQRSFNPINLPIAELGWPEVTDAVAKAYRDVPPDKRKRTALIASSYWQAGALEHFGPERGLPERAYSPHRGFWYFGHPPANTTSALFAGTSEAHLRKFFGTVRLVAVSDTGIDGKNDNAGSRIYFCEDPVAPWPELWYRMRTFDFPR